MSDHDPGPSSRPDIELISTGTPSRPPAPRRGILVAATAAISIGLGLLILTSDPSGETSDTTVPSDDEAATSSTTTATTGIATTLDLPTDRLDVGAAWLDSIVDNDGETFRALHEPGFSGANDTLMMWGARDQRPFVFGDRYFDGFDAFQAAVEIDDDIITPEPCRPVDADKVYCGLTTTLVGGPETSTTFVVLTVNRNGAIVNARLDPGTTEPVDLFRYWRDFTTNNATERDRDCLAIGFNSVTCGIQESNILRRYVDFYRSQTGSG